MRQRIETFLIIFKFARIGIKFSQEGRKKNFMSYVSEKAGKDGKPSYSKGLEGVIIGESKKCFIDGERGYLAYVGIPIEQLAENSTYEEVCFLLLNDRLPTERELRDFKKLLYSYREIPSEVYSIIKSSARYGVHPMAILRVAVDYLSIFDEEAEINTDDLNYIKALRLISKLHTITASIGRVIRGLEPVHPLENVSVAANWLWIYKGQKPSEEEERIFDIILILHAEHEINASTFSARVVISSFTDIYSAVIAAIGSLKGPLHGGANEDVMNMLSEIKDPSNVEEYVKSKLSRKEKIPGFGHRVYKNYDPRAAILKSIAEKLAEKNSRVKHWLEIGKRIEKFMIDNLGQKGIYPNVDFFSGIVMSYLGIEPRMFTPIFATGRIVGWLAHIIEQLKDNRIFRPRIIYTGPEELNYVPINQRS
ncbi:Citrate synthase [bacterium HR19]|nr:Citrate synthase [bacterium HR19]